MSFCWLNLSPLIIFSLVLVWEDEWLLNLMFNRYFIIFFISWKFPYLLWITFASPSNFSTTFTYIFWCKLASIYFFRAAWNVDSVHFNFPRFFVCCNISISKITYKLRNNIAVVKNIFLLLLQEPIKIMIHKLSFETKDFLHFFFSKSLSVTSSNLHSLVHKI